MSDAEVIEEMIAEENVLDLAKKFAKEGYLGVESLIAVKENGKTIVVEGNRRLTALKVLLKPDLVSGPQKTAFLRLSKELGGNLPRKVSVLTAPSRAEANVYIYSKHAGSGFEKKWKLMQQAVWVEQRMHEGMSLAEMLSDYPISESQIAEARAALQLLRLAPHAEVPPDVAATVNDSKSNWYSTVIERLLRPPSCRKLLKVNFNAESGLEYTGSDSGFIDVLGEILTGAFKEDEGRKGTRRFNTVEDSERFLKELNYKPSGPKKSGADLVAKLSARAPVSSGQSTKKKSAPKKETSRRRREHRLFEPPLNGPLLAHKRRKVLIEMEKMTPIVNYVNTIGVMLRVLLEITLRAALEHVGDLRKLEKAPGIGRWGPQLGDMLAWVIDGKSNLDLSSDQVNQFKVFKGAKKNTLNKYIHGAHYPATKSEIEDLATKMRPVLDTLLNARKK